MSFSHPYKYINADELASMLKSSQSNASSSKRVAVVDVRDDDFAGGNIVSAINVPSETFYDNVTSLVKQLDKVPTVVFHCALSQSRGPKAARVYAETRSTVVKDASNQEIYVLRDGFKGFQARYRNDPLLVEKLNRFYHGD